MLVALPPEVTIPSIFHITDFIIRIISSINEMPVVCVSPDSGTMPVGPGGRVGDVEAGIGMDDVIEELDGVGGHVLEGEVPDGAMA
jgi:hypothetical protein